MSIAVFLEYASIAQNLHFLYIPIVNVPVFWNGPFKEPDGQYSRNFVSKLELVWVTYGLTIKSFANVVFPQKPKSDFLIYQSLIWKRLQSVKLFLLLNKSYCSCYTFIKARGAFQYVQSAMQYPMVMSVINVFLFYQSFYQKVTKQFNTINPLCLFRLATEVVKQEKL